MGSSDFSANLVLGALAGLLVVAVGYAQLVWLQRRRQAKEAHADGSPSPLALLFWGCLIASAVCLLHAVSSRSLPDQDAQVVGEDLFAIAPRPGLVATYEARNKVVHKDDLLLRFSGREGEEGQIGIKSRKQILQGDLEMENARPLEFDSAALRRLDAAKARLKERTSRQSQVMSERDAIKREAQQQELNINNRRFQAEQELLPAQRELGPLAAELETARTEMESQEALLRQGLLSKMEVARQRDRVTALEEQVAEHKSHIAQVEQLLKEVAALGAQVERTYGGQTASRGKELEELGRDIAKAQKEVAADALLVEQDRPRALAQQAKRIQQIEVQIAECDAMLAGSGKDAQVRAPFDGRVGFREPSPSSVPSDNGPLLVLYKPGSITTTLHFNELDMTGQADPALQAELVFAPQAEGEGRAVPGEVLSQMVSRGESEIVVACDPPERVVRAIAMGGSVPARVHLRHGVTTALDFRIGLALGGLALLLALARALRSRLEPTQPGSQPPAPPPARGPDETGPHGIPDFSGGAMAAGFNPYRVGAMPGFSGAARLALPSSTQRTQPPPTALAVASSREGIMLPEPREEDRTADQRDPRYLRRLGAKLREDLEHATLSPALIHRTFQIVGEGGLPMALVMSGFGVAVDRRRLARAAFVLHLRVFEAPPPFGGPRQAAFFCAEFLRVMRVVSSDRLGEVVDSVRSELIATTLAAAQSTGATSESAGLMVRYLMEV